MKKRFLVIGGVAAGSKAAAKARRCDPEMEIVIYQEEEEISYAGCGLPYYVSGLIKERSELVSRTPGKFAQDGIRVLKHRRIENIDVENHTVSGRNLESGLRSYKACLRLQHAGIDNVKNIDGGMLCWCYDVMS